MWDLTDVSGPDHNLSIFLMENNMSNMIFSIVCTTMERGQCCTIILLHMTRLNKTESAIFVSLMCFSLLEGRHSKLF